MDQGPLVAFQRDDGQRLLDRLVEDGVPVTGACWLKESDDGQWFLFIATPLVRDDGPSKPAYRAIGSVLDNIPQPFGIDSLEIKVVPSDDLLAQAIHEFHKQYPGRTVPLFGAGSFGGLSIDGIYIYPPIRTPVR